MEITTHKNTMEVTAVAVPMVKTSFVFVTRLIRNKNGMMKILRDMKLMIIPRFFKYIAGKVMTHVKIMALVGMSDHDIMPSMARLQIRHTKMAMKSVDE